MDERWKQMIWNQLGACIDSLERAMHACPDSLWGDRSRKPEFWYVAYHTLFFLDFYVGNQQEGFAPPEPFGLEELDPAGVLPPRVYQKAELQEYLELTRLKCRRTLAGLTAEVAEQRCAFDRRDITFSELLLYVMRHVQHHAAQLNVLLRQEVDSAPGWVSTAGKPLND